MPLHKNIPHRGELYATVASQMDVEVYVYAADGQDVPAEVRFDGNDIWVKVDRPRRIDLDPADRAAIAQLEARVTALAEELGL